MDRREHRLERQLASFVQQLSLRQLFFLLTEICYELQYRIDTGDNLTLPESESDVEFDSFSVSDDEDL